MNKLFTAAVFASVLTSGFAIGADAPSASAGTANQGQQIPTPEPAAGSKSTGSKRQKANVDWLQNCIVTEQARNPTTTKAAATATCKARTEAEAPPAP